MASSQVALEARAAERVRVQGADGLAGRGPHAVSAAGIDLVLVRTPAGPRLFQGRCPHQGALLGEGELEAGGLVCRNHRWRFNVDSGAREDGPGCLVACPATERAGELFVDLSPLRAAQAAQTDARASGPATATEAAGTRPGTRPGTPRRRLRDLPGPRGLPFVGNALQLDLDHLHLTLEQWAATHGSVFAFRLGRKLSVVVSDPELIQQVLRSRPDTYRRVAKVQTVFQELAVDGVFSAEGSAWRAQRRLAMEALSQRHLRGFYPTLRTMATRLLNRWLAVADSGQPTDMVDDLKRFTVDVTTMLTFGHDMNTIEHAGDDIIQRRLELLFPAFNRRIFALVPYWRLLRLPRDRRLDKTIGELRAWIDGLVRDARVRLLSEPERAARPSNFLEAMLAARDESDQPFSDDTIFANLMTMLLAGEDTTALTLAWAVHEMCQAPTAIAPLRAELDEALKGEAVASDIETAMKLAYPAAIANEAMRLRPVAPLIFFETLVDTCLGDLDIPAATPVGVLLRPPVLDAQRFTTPELFLPERWLSSPGNHDASSHLPFGSGPRICPGRSLALLEMKVVLAMLYQNFDVAREGSSADVREMFAFTMGPSRVMVRLSRRVPPVAPPRAPLSK